MKCKFLSLLLFLIIFALIFTSCSDNTATDTDATEIVTQNKLTVTVVDSIKGTMEIEPYDNVAKSPVCTNYITDNGQIKEYDYNNLKSKFGIDVSSYCGDINWQKVKDYGIEFAMIRIGGRGYGDTGNIYLDQNAITNIQNAHNCGIDVGVYFFSQAITTQEAVEEAKFVIENLDGIDLQLPVAYDFEFIDEDTARTDNITGAQMTEFAIAFCDTIENAGYKSMIYGESNDFYSQYDLSQLNNSTLWYAEYSAVPNFYYDFKIWQYSKEGQINGIEGNVDLNILFVEK